MFYFSRVRRIKDDQFYRPLPKKLYKKKLRAAKRIRRWRNFAVIVAALVVCSFGVVSYAQSYIEDETGYSIEELQELAVETAQASTADDFYLYSGSEIYAEDGTLIATVQADHNAIYLEYEDIPENVQNAFVAVEDRTFWTNEGVDYQGILRAIYSYYIAGSSSELTGASTITQQLVKLTYLSSERTIARKLKEIFIAQELTKKYSKEEIMEFYCNNCCFANAIYGIEAAAEAYFGVSAKELTLSQTAYLCAIPNEPEYYDPWKDPSVAIERRDKILGDMLECGFITQVSYDQAIAEEINVKERANTTIEYDYEATYAMFCATEYLMEQSGFVFKYEFDNNDAYNEYQDYYSEAYDAANQKLKSGGYKIYTTLNLETQEGLQNVVDEYMNSQFTEKLESGVYKVQAALTVIDNATGKVVAIVGGRTSEDGENTYTLNRAYQGYAQPGSSFKPISTYTPAFEAGYSEESTVKEIDVEEAQELNDSEKIAKMSGSTTTIKDAVTWSRNGCAYWLFNEITPSFGMSYIEQLHFSRIYPGDYTLSACLGGLTYGVTTEEMAGAYSCLANRGMFTDPTCLTSILDAGGNEIYASPESTRVYSTVAADTMTDLMMNVIKNGTAATSYWYSSTDTEAAGKTGTTDDSKAGWFCGYTPYYTIAVWVGCDTPEEIYNLWGSTYPLSIWKNSMLYMIEDLPTAEFEIGDLAEESDDIVEPVWSSSDDDDDDDDEKETKSDSSKDSDKKESKNNDKKENKENNNNNTSGDGGGDSSSNNSTSNNDSSNNSTSNNDNASADPCANGHSWDGGVITVESYDCQHLGQICYTCTVCGTQKDEQYTTPHNYVDGVCTVCGAKQ